jgi:cobalt-precorrin 5A hydrolase
MSTANKTAVIAVTEKGLLLAKKIASEIPADTFAPSKLSDENIMQYESLNNCFQTLFHEYKNIIAVMAQGIVTRMIAPLVTSKYTDPAVVTCDEVGRFAISTLSGHEGGANILAHLVSSVTGAVPVITTATEANRLYVIGIGCRKGAGMQDVISAIDNACTDAGIERSDIRLIASAWIKKYEKGLTEAAAELGLYLRFIPESYYNNQFHRFEEHSAPKKHFGIPGVALPSAVIAASNPQIVLERRVYGDVTAAIVKEMVANEQ